MTERIEGSSSLRFGELLVALADEFAVNTSSASFKHDPTLHLLQAAGPHRAHELGLFLRWSRELYLANHAKFVEARPSIPHPDQVGSAFSLVGSMTTSDEPPEYTVIRERVPFPSMRALLSMHPSDLIGARMSGSGAEYLAALGAWRDRPSRDTKEAVIVLLHHFAKDICKRLSRPISTFALLRS